MTYDLFSYQEEVVKPDPEQATDEILTVFELTSGIKYLLEENFPHFYLKGEVSNLTFHRSGHIYFTLKDDRAQIKCVVWRTRAARLSYKPREGTMIVVRGKLSIYEKGGYYQVVVDEIQAEGVGQLQQAFEQLKQNLLKEGLFESQHKKPLPVYPQSIGIITSQTGAALRDIQKVIRRRMPAFNWS